MLIRINPQSGTPLNSQLCEQIKHAVASGRLKPGERLPTVRDLATELRINPNTVAKAYRDLGQEDVLVLRHGSGVFVSAKPPTMHKHERVKLLKGYMDRAIVEGLHFELEADELKQVFEERLRALMVDDGKQTKGGRRS